MTDFTIQPRDIPKTGDDTPASSVFRYLWRMSGHHQIWICLLALFVAGLSMVPLELQRRIVNEVVGDKSLELLLGFGTVYLGLLLVQGLSKYGLRIYQGWLSESAIRFNREHLARLHECRTAKAEDAGRGQAVSVIGSEIDKLGGFVGEGLSTPVVNAGMLAAVGGYMIAVEPLVALISLMFLIPQVVLVPVIQRYINALIAERVTMIRGLSDTLTALPQDCNDLAATALPGELDGIYGNRMRMYFLKFALKALVNLLNGLAPLSALLVGGYMVMQGETTIGVVVAFISGFDRLAAPLRELLAYYRVAAQAHVQHEMIARWM